MVGFTIDIGMIVGTTFLVEVGSNVIGIVRRVEVAKDVAGTGRRLRQALMQVTAAVQLGSMSTQIWPKGHELESPRMKLIVRGNSTLSI